SFSFKKYDEKGFLPYLYSSLIKIITISFKLKRVVYKSNYNSIYTFHCIFLYVNYSCNVISDRILAFPDFLSVFECLSDKVPDFLDSLSVSEHLSDKRSCFPRFFDRFRAFIGQTFPISRFFDRFRAFIGQSFPISRYSVRYPNSSLATPQNPPLSPAHYPRSNLPQSQSTYIQYSI